MKRMPAIVACLIIVSLVALVSSQVQLIGLISSQTGKTAQPSTNQISDSTKTQNPTSNVQSSEPNLLENSNGSTSSPKTDEQQNPNVNNLSANPSQTNINGSMGPAVPFPDGRIFLPAQVEAGDAIPYIPTANPKTTIGIQVTPPEPDA